MIPDKSILVVDDELLIRDLLYDFFNSQGWKISVAENGQKALEVLEEQKIDLVLTDLKMPTMDGMTLTKRLKEIYPDMPVVVMTGYPSVDSAIEAIHQKVSDYIVKPFNINKLFKSVQAQLTVKED
ncbi:MAG: response regulator [bacterium]|nr:response regulator [bacterium]